MQGRLKLSLETDRVSVVTHFKGLEIPRLGSGDTNDTGHGADGGQASRLLHQSILANDGDADRQATTISNAS